MNIHTEEMHRQGTGKRLGVSMPSLGTTTPSAPPYVHQRGGLQTPYFWDFYGGFITLA